MNKEIKPIYDFKNLKKTLSDMGFYIPKAQGYKALEIHDVDLNEIKQNIEFNNDGIFIFDKSDNIRRQIFLYKRKYHLEKYGKPRFHIRKCRTIQDFINSGTFIAEYRRANTETVTVIDIDNNGDEIEISDLPLCKYCAAMTGLQGNHSTNRNFVDLLKQENKNIEIDIFGYTRNWEMISKAYREIHNYTCEKCGFRARRPFESQYIHVHHINGDKTDNREENLQCLCIKCHSEVNAHHKERFSFGGNRVMLSDFINKYHRE